MTNFEKENNLQNGYHFLGKNLFFKISNRCFSSNINKG